MSSLFKTAAVFLAGTLVAGGSGCQSEQDMKYHEAMALIKRPINCATAEGDIRVLMSEKAHVQNQIASGVTSIAPIGLVVGLATGQEGENLQIGTGEYNRLIDQRIAEIKQHCGLN